MGRQERCGAYWEEPIRAKTPMLAAAALKCPHPTQEQGSPPQAPLTCAGAGVRAPAWLLQREPPPTATRGTCQGHCEAWAHFPSEGAEGEEVRPLEPPRRDRTSRAVVLSAALLRSQSGLPPHLAGEAGLTCSCSAPPGGVPRGRDPWRLEVGGAAVCEGALAVSPRTPKTLTCALQGDHTTRGALLPEVERGRA